MPFTLQLRFMPIYDKNLGYKHANIDIDLLNQVIDTKITCNETALRFSKTLEEATLCWFQILLERMNDQSEKGNYFDRQLSSLMGRDVIAPQVTFSTYKSELFEREFESDDPDEESYDEFLDLYADMYQGGRRGESTLPLLTLKYPYVVERKTGIKLRISQQTIVRLGWLINKKYGFRIFDCTNFSLLHQIKD